jgi:hypothetical protein
VPLWEALSRRHHAAARLLADAGADLSSGDGALYARAAVEADDAALLESVARHGVDVTAACWDDGATALHRAVLQGNAGMVRVLLERGADPDRVDGAGRTPRAMAVELGRGDVQELISGWRQEVAEGLERQGPATDHGGRIAAQKVARFQSAPPARVPPCDNAGSSPPPLLSRQSTPRQMVSLRNSLFGVHSSSHVNRHDGGGGGGGLSRHERHAHSSSRARVTISCPEQGSSARKLVFMPETVTQLLEQGGSTFGFAPTRAVTTDGAEVDDSRLVRDGDCLLLVTDQWVPDIGIMGRYQ